VGDTVVMMVSITNNLPNAITVDSVRVSLSTVEDYEDAVTRQQHQDGKDEDGTVIMEEVDAFCVFHVDGSGVDGDAGDGDGDDTNTSSSSSPSVLIQPGENTYKIHWTPMT